MFSYFTHELSNFVTKVPTMFAMFAMKVDLSEYLNNNIRVKAWLGGLILTFEEFTSYTT
jgi:hypothetical protein